MTDTHNSPSVFCRDFSALFNPCQLCPCCSEIASSASSMAKSCLGGTNFWSSLFTDCKSPVKGFTSNLCCAFTSTKKIAFQGWDIPNCKETSYSKMAGRTTVIKDSIKSYNNNARKDTIWCMLIACSKSQHRGALDTGSNLLKKLVNHLVNKERSCLWLTGSKNYN